MTFPAAAEVWGAESVTSNETDTCPWISRPLGSPQAQCRGPSLRPLGKQRCLKGTQVTLTVPTTTSHHALPFQALGVSTSLRLGPREWSCLISPTRVSSSVKGNENRTDSDCGRETKRRVQKAKLVAPGSWHTALPDPLLTGFVYRLLPSRVAAPLELGSIPLRPTMDLAPYRCSRNIC